MLILHVVGARPNFMKAAPVHRVLAARGVRQILVHTGQHYDARMSDVFFQELELPEPDLNLEVGSGSHSRQTAEVMVRFEPVVLEHKPELVLVYGDVNSTVAAALVCAKLGFPVGHVEAGLRSFDRTMPEEINRLVTDQLAHLLFTPSLDGNDNLRREGVEPGKIHFVGNVMIDTLTRLLPRAEERWPGLWNRLVPGTQVEKWERYALVTLHRPSNVDEAGGFRQIVKGLATLAREIPLLFPVHPRTRLRLGELGLAGLPPNLFLTEPVGYLDFLALQRHAALVITDSGGIQEETTFLHVPCLTMRENTERPITVTLGTNILVGQDVARMQSEAKEILAKGGKEGTIPPLWDGRASNRIADALGI